MADSKMNVEAEIEELKIKVEALEDELVLMYDALNKRIDDIQSAKGHNLTIWGIAITLMIGALQIIVALWINH